jgi:hypothetical protein
MTWADYIQIFLIILLVGGLAGVIYTLGLFVGDKDNLSEIQKKLAIISGTSAALILMLGIFSYLYLRVNPGAFVPFVLVMLFLNLELSLTAVSVSVLQKTQ